MIRVYYDSSCILCRRYKQAIELLDKGQINWIDIHDDHLLPAGLTKEALLSDIHAIDTNNRITVGPDAIALIISTIPAAKRFSWLMEKDSTKKTIDIFHKTSDRLRRKLINSCPTCKNRHL